MIRHRLREDKIELWLPVLAAFGAVLVCAGCSSDDDGQPAVDGTTIVDSQVERDAGVDLAPIRDAAVDQLQPDQHVGPSSWDDLAVNAGGALLGIGGTSATNIYAVGKGGVVMHYDGNGWSSEDVGIEEDLRGVAALGEDEVYIVGGKTILYFDGTGWDDEEIYSGSLEAVWGLPGNKPVWAVGGGGTIRRNDNDGTYSYWSWVTTSTEKNLHGIWGVSDTEVYVVGDDGLVLLCDGTIDGYGDKCEEMTTPVKSNLQAIHGISGDEIYAVGFNGDVIRFNGTVWEKIETTTDSYLHGVWGISGSDLFVVGHPLFVADESAFHYNGSAWQKVPPGTYTAFNGVWGPSASEVYAVTNFGILKFKGM